jgi:hypothetical protein
MRKRIVYLLMFILVFTACESNPLDVDVSDQEVEINLHRYDQELFTAKNIEELVTVNKKMLHESGELYEFYTMEMLRAGSPHDDSIAVFLNYFIKDSMMLLVHENMQAEFGDFKVEQDKIVDMFKHLKYHIPIAMLPTDVVIYNSTFANGVISTPTQIGLGLEMYLGSENEVIQKLPYPEYFKVKMSSDYLMADIAQSWLMNNVIEDQSGQSFLSNMIYYGKILYTVDAMLPDLEDHKKIKYSEQEYEWSEVSEYDIWKYVVEQNYIYSKDIKLLVRYFNEAPTTVGLDGSPSRIGQFLGWRIIKSYMEKNPEVTVRELIAEKNETKILKSYKPKK